MSDKNNPMPRTGSPLLFPEDPGNGYQGNGASRRKFLKRTGGATAATFLGWSASQQNIRAQNPPGGETPPPSEEDEDECEWEDAYAIWELPLQYDVDTLINLLWVEPSVKTYHSNDIANLRTYLGVTAGDKIEHTYTQRADWEECVKRDESGDVIEAPKRFKNLKYTYGPNKIEGMAFNSLNGGLTPYFSPVSSKFGYFLYTTSHFPNDKWVLGGMTVTAGDQGITGSPNSPTRYYPGGGTVNITDKSNPNYSKVRATFGAPPNNDGFDCHTVNAINEWDGTGLPEPENKNGVGNLELRHETWVTIKLLANAGPAVATYDGRYGEIDEEGNSMWPAFTLQDDKCEQVRLKDWQSSEEQILPGSIIYPGDHPDAPGLLWSAWKIHLIRPGTYTV